ncbi:MAG TPA: Smr/MutS family protein [Pyrinomonadaceae bacterium]|nr:Smr/MutS family protein [Pyrinomonadaceae bacterium]
MRESSSHKDSMERAQAEIDEAGEIDPFNPFPEPVALEIGDIFDLHTIAPREVEGVVEEYLLEARRAGFRSVRIIHGKGKGVQREIVRSILARTSFVESWTDAPPLAGGWGATVAQLQPEQDDQELIG